MKYILLKSVAAGLCSLCLLSNGFTLNDLSKDDESNKTDANFDSNLNMKRTSSSEEDVDPDEDKPRDFATNTTKPFHAAEHSERNQCCYRHSHYRAIGFDLAGNDHIVDVGMCRRKCMRHNKAQKENDLRFSGTGVNDFVKENTLENVSTLCDPNDLCEPVRTVIEKHHLFGGAKDIQVVGECKCLSNPIFCQRLSRKILLFQDTPYEKEIDVGMCRGACETDNKCVPFRNRTVSIEGSNGVQCVEVIEECGCGTACYRMHYNETYFEAIWDEETNNTISKRKEIDVGRCVGQCPDSDRYKCILRDETKQESCLMSLASEASRCTAVEFTTHSFFTVQGKRRTVLAIDACSCN